MMVFCTLFDSNYLDKGLVMYRSLVRTGCDFKMYVLAMDEKCKDVLDAYQYQNLITISIDHFVEEEGLVDIRKNRSRAEFCWTCTSFLIDYVLCKYDEPICTYIDSDLYFYSNPQCLIEEMEDKTVQIVEHRFESDFRGRLSAATSGSYCVEFNTFVNSEESLKLLSWWKERCMESCSIDEGSKKVFGDQGYLEGWEKYPYVNVLKNHGGGVAPWNISRYKLYQNADTPILMDRRTKDRFVLIFYHFHNIKYYEKRKVNIYVYSDRAVDEKLVTKLYLPYLRELDETKNELNDRFGFYPLLTFHPGFVKKDKKEYRIKDISRLFDRHFVARLYAASIGKITIKRNLRKNVIVF